jgi:dihydropteroate synthase
MNCDTMPTAKAVAWTLKRDVLRFDRGPLIMGIINVTPDSFSDGGKHFTTQLAIDQALRLEDQGADILDIGGESTRPYSVIIDAGQEMQRVLPVLEAIQGRVKIPVSIDTSKSNVAAAAIDLGAQIVNDVTGLSGDPAMPETVARSGVGVCAMHMQGTPQTMQDNPTYQNVTAEILDYLRQCDRRLLAAGVSAEKICLDPGIGFGKTHAHNIELIRNIRAFHQLERPILVGHSRKGFISKLLDDKSADRDIGTLGISLLLARSGIQVLRVHEVAMTKQALKTFIACGALDG